MPGPSGSSSGGISNAKCWRCGHPAYLGLRELECTNLACELFPYKAEFSWMLYPDDEDDSYFMGSD